VWFLILQAANEKSFAVLQEYLHLARADQEAHGAPGRTFHLEFYVKKEHYAAEIVAKAGSSTERVEMMLAPPSRRTQAQLEAGSLAPSTLKAIFKLLTKCGITPDYASAGSSSSYNNNSGDAEDRWWAAVRLVDFLPEAAERVRLMGAVRSTAGAARQVRTYVNPFIPPFLRLAQPKRHPKPT
jgi:hypothetical protein